MPKEVLLPGRGTGVVSRSRRLRTLSVGLGIAASVLLGLPSGLTAQPMKVARVAILSVGAPGNQEIEAFREGLRERGWMEGQNLVVEARFGEWHYDRLPGLATELVRWRPDVIFTHTTPGVVAAQQATRTIPIVVGAAGALVEKRIVTSLARPGGNVTGLTLLDVELDAKRLQLLKEVAPAVTRVTFLTNPALGLYPAMERTRSEAAQALGLRLARLDVRAADELEVAFASMDRAKTNAVLVANDAMFAANRTRISDLAIKYRLPAISENPPFAEAGGLLAYGPRIPAMFRRAAGYVDRILKGSRPADLPIEQPDTFRLVVNLKTAKVLGISVPPSVLARADQVID
jgi:putative tryptophan/tyrosine transport system substrate-binding protein